MNMSNARAFLARQARIAAEHGMTVAEYKKHLAKQSAKATRELSKKLGYPVSKVDRRRKTLNPYTTRGSKS